MIQAVGTAPDLGVQIMEADKRRATAWRLQFFVVWAIILAGLVGFVMFTVKLDGTFLTKVVPFIVGGVGVTIFVSFCSIVLAIVLATLGALGRLSRNPVANGIASFYVSLVRARRCCSRSRSSTWPCPRPASSWTRSCAASSRSGSTTAPT